MQNAAQGTGGFVERHRRPAWHDRATETGTASTQVLSAAQSSNWTDSSLPYGPRENPAYTLL
jgi:hypothetical protein